MYFRDFYHLYPHGAPIGGVILLLLAIVIEVAVKRGAES
jgi:hypothetical protein